MKEDAGNASKFLLVKEPCWQSRMEGWSRETTLWVRNLLWEWRQHPHKTPGVVYECLYPLVACCLASWPRRHGGSTSVRGQPLQLRSLPAPLGCWGLDLGSQAWQRAPFPAESSHRPFHCLLNADAMCPTASSSCHCGLPTQTDYTSESGSIRRLRLLSLLSPLFHSLLLPP